MTTKLQAAIEAGTMAYIAKKEAQIELTERLTVLLEAMNELNKDAMAIGLCIDHSLGKRFDKDDFEIIEEEI